MQKDGTTVILNCRSSNIIIIIIIIIIIEVKNQTYSEISCACVCRIPKTKKTIVDRYTVSVTEHEKLK